MELWLAAAAVSGLVGVAAGAFGAHGLEGRASAEELAAFETGARYQMYHALALFAVAWLADKQPDATSVMVAGWAFVAGTVLFSGSLYVLGGQVIRPFAFAMMLGVAVGTYSSIYIASPTLLLLEGLMDPDRAKKKKKAAAS